MYTLKVGNKVEEFQGLSDGVKFNISDGGTELIILLNKPTSSEIESIKSGKLQFGMFVKNDIIFLLSKFGNMNWMDAPFHIALAKNLTVLQDIEEGKGYGCTIILVDTSTGEIKALRYVSFSTEFSKRLKANIEEQKSKQFNKIEYSIKLSEIFMNYTTDDMVKFSEINCKIK